MYSTSTIDLCLSLHPWAPFRSTKAAIKLHTLLDLHGSIPSFIHITDGKTHEVNVMDDLVIQAGAFYLMDNAQDFMARVAKINTSQCPACKHGRLRVVQTSQGHKRLPDPLAAMETGTGVHQQSRAPPAQGP